MNEPSKTVFDVVREYNLPEDNLEAVIYRMRPGSERFMFLMQNPGIEKAPYREKEEHQRVNEKAKGEGWSEEERLRQHVDWNNKFLLQWLRGKNENRPKKFSEGFRGVFQKVFGAAKGGDFGRDSDEEFWRRLYITDYVKRRAATRDIEETDFDRWQKVLEWEIGSLKNKNLELIMVFGARTWDNFNRKIDNGLIPISTTAKANTPVTDVHGHLFKSQKYNVFVIPLVHMSHQPFQNALRNSYFDYLEEGLRKSHVKR